MEPFARLLGRLAAQRATGHLAFHAGEARRDLYLKNGTVVQAGSRLTEEALGSQLVSMGVISGSQRDQVLERAASQGRLLGDVLIESGLMSPMDVVEALVEQTRRRVLNCLRPEEYQARFREGERPPASFQVEVSIPALLLARVTEAVCLERITSHLSLSAGSRLHLTVPVSEAAADLGAGPRHIKLMRSFTDGPVEDLVRSEDEYETLLGLAYTLWALGRLEVSTERRDAGPGPVSPEHGAGRERASDRQAQAVSARQADAGRPAEAGKDARAGSRALAVHRRGLMESLKRSERVTGKVGRRSPGPLAPADEVIDAWLRAERQDYFTLLGVARDASPSDVKIAFGGMLRRLHLENPPADWPKEAKDAASGLLKKASLAFAILTDPKERRSYEEHVEKGAAAKFKPADPMVLAGVSIRSAERLRSRGRFQDAAEELRRACANLPKEPALHLELGRTLYEWMTHGEAGVQDEAAQALAAAARMDPALDGPWTFLGLLARHKGDEDNARKMFRRALAVNPRNEKAVAELSELEPQGGLFGKLFGK